VKKREYNANQTPWYVDLKFQREDEETGEEIDLECQAEITILKDGWARVVCTDCCKDAIRSISSQVHG
jgi:hypothetical protein